jgi:hypothetical protein
MGAFVKPSSGVSVVLTSRVRKVPQESEALMKLFLTGDEFVKNGVSHPTRHPRRS